MKTPTYSRKAIDEAKARVWLSEFVKRHVVLRAAGHELVGLCPFHAEETPSFRVNDTKGLFNCFGCGASGDVLEWLQRQEGLSFPQACQVLVGHAALPEAEVIDRKAAVARERADRLEAIQYAQSIWRRARRINGTQAEAYLKSRGISADIQHSAARFARVPLWRNKETGATGPTLPALVMGARDLTGYVVGVQCIFLTEDGLAKAAIDNPKRSYGQVKGSAVRLGPAARRIILVEGPEDGLTLRMNNPGAPIWVTLGTGSMHAVELPDVVEEVRLAGDNNNAGLLAVGRAVATYEDQGRWVDAMFPAPEFEDWNDEHRGIRVKLPDVMSCEPA